MKTTRTTDYKAIAVHPTSAFGGLVVIAVNNGMDETLTTGFDYGNGLEGVRTTPVHYSITGRPYIIRYQHAYYLDEMECVLQA